MNRNTVLGKRVRARRADLVGHGVQTSLRVFHKHAGKLLGAGVVCVLIGPRGTGIEKLIGDARTARGDIKVEALIVYELAIVDDAGLGGLDHLAGVLELDA